MNVFILAAGLGERLRPITNHLPKPLLPILEKPAIDIVLDKVLQLTPLKICVNLHYKAQLLRDWIANHILRERILSFEEPDLLGTGGALWNARKTLLREDIFLVHNADVLSDVDLSMLLDFHRASRNLATLCVVDYQPVNSLHIDSSGLLYAIGNCGHSNCKRRTFTGIAVYSSGFINLLPEGRSSVVDGWRRAIDMGYRIGTTDITGTYWTDIGGPEAYASAIFGALRLRQERVFIDSTFKDCAKLSYEGRVVIGPGCLFTDSVKLKDAIVMPHTVIDRPMDVSRAIIGSDYMIPLNIPDEESDKPIGGGGSERAFYRIDYKGLKAVKMQCKEGDEEYQRHLDYTEFFYERGIPVPQLLEADQRGYNAVFEDLGDRSLYDWMRCPRDEEALLGLYDRVFDGLIKMHTLKIEDKAPRFRTFDYDYFRWETEYFIREYVMGLRAIPQIPEAVLRDLDYLAKRASSYVAAIIHRDLQSQNIMVRPDGGIAFIDYQGSRLGPPAYDVASLCYDPYVSINNELRGQLCHLYISKRPEGAAFDKAGFLGSLVFCRLQRLMQALGAYSFLSMKRGKRHFQRHIPSALRLLKESAVGAEEGLTDLCRFLQGL